jgi:hypothetical protein
MAERISLGRSSRPLPGREGVRMEASDAMEAEDDDKQQLRRCTVVTRRAVTAHGPAVARVGR